MSLKLFSNGLPPIGGPRNQFRRSWQASVEWNGEYKRASHTVKAATVSGNLLQLHGCVPWTRLPDFFFNCRTWSIKSWETLSTSTNKRWIWVSDKPGFWSWLVATYVLKNKSPNLSEPPFCYLTSVSLHFAISKMGVKNCQLPGIGVRCQWAGKQSATECYLDKGPTLTAI